MNNPQISCKDLSLGYGGRSIVSNLSFDVYKGDYICIIGDNGAGKSTLLKSMLGLMPLVSGRIEFAENLDKIGYLPQQTDIQKDFPASVREVVMSGCLNRSGLFPFYSKADKALAYRNMERLNILPISKSCYRELSGGQQQRVLLARALCAANDVMFMDEPTAGLDPQSSAELYETIDKLNKDGLTIIMISHEVNTAIEHASHVLHIKRGEPCVFERRQSDG